MNALALIIGIANYSADENKLINAVNDAEDLGKELLRLGFVVRIITDCTREIFGREIQEFGKELEKYDVGLFYFSGHGLQIEGKNYLTAVDTSFADEASAKYTSFTLDEVIGRMEKAGPSIKILILDACRDNPLPKMYRSIMTQGLAPIHAPKGTLIAFSTSPGEKAMDYGAGRNSIYTGSLLNHINDAYIPIEEFFKRVRTSVFELTAGKQTSWEHTSLIGTFYFNSGSLIHSVEIPYKEEYVADKNFVSSGNEIDEIIMGLKSHNYYTQNPAYRKLDLINLQSIDKDSLFLLGRNVLQTAIGGEFESENMFKKNLGGWLDKFNADNAIHVLNGILFEIYFNSDGKFRMDNFKSKFIDEIFRLQTRYPSSFDFINKALTPFRKFLFYIPQNPPMALPIELKFEVIERQIPSPGKQHRLLSVKNEGVELLRDGRFGGLGNKSYLFDDFVEELSKKLIVSKNLLRLSMDAEEKDINEILAPHDFELSKDGSSPTDSIL